jgi:hypothetical protein
MFALALFGYPLVAGVGSLLRVDSAWMSVPFRLLLAVSALVLLLPAPVPRLSLARATTLLIWVAYAARLAHDAAFAALPDAIYALQFFVASAVLPALALACGSQWQQPVFARNSLIVAMSACVLALVGSAADGSSDADLTEATRRLTLVALDPISLGHLSTSAIFCCAVLWRHSAGPKRWLLIAATTLALATLVATGSKGPALALGLVMLAWSIRRTRSRWPLLALALPAAVLLLLSGDNPLAARVAASSEDLSTLDRLVLIENSLRQIEASPWWGSAFVELESGYYPHNIVLEAGMALGLPLTLVLLGLLWHTCRLAWRALASFDEDLLGLLFLQGLIEVTLSGAIFGATLLWISMALLLRPRRPTRRASAHSYEIAVSARGMPI